MTKESAVMIKNGKECLQLGKLFSPATHPMEDLYQNINRTHYSKYQEQKQHN